MISGDWVLVQVSKVQKTIDRITALKTITSFQAIPICGSLHKGPEFSGVAPHQRFSV